MFRNHHKVIGWSTLPLRAPPRRCLGRHLHGEFWGASTGSRCAGVGEDSGKSGGAGRILEFLKHRSICLGNLRGPSSLGAVFTEFHLINVLLQNLAMGNFHVVGHWTEFLYDNTGNPLV